MNKQVSNTKHIVYRIVSILMLTFILISCQQPFTSNPFAQNIDSTLANTDVVVTQTIDISKAPKLPGVYISPYINRAPI